MTWALATIAVLLVAYAAFSRRLQLLSVSGAMFFTTAGLLARPVLGLLDLRLESEQVKLLAGSRGSVQHRPRIVEGAGVVRGCSAARLRTEDRAKRLDAMRARTADVVE